MPRKPPEPYRMPTRVGDVVYPSVKDAAKALGIAPSTLSTLIARGREEHAGKGRGNHGQQRPPIAAVPLTIGPTTYPSTRAAAKALGVPLCRIKKLRKLQRAREAREAEGRDE